MFITVSYFNHNFPSPTSLYFALQRMKYYVQHRKRIFSDEIFICVHSLLQDIGEEDIIMIFFFYEIIAMIGKYEAGKYSNSWHTLNEQLSNFFPAIKEERNPNHRRFEFLGG